jgi:hypothetical protein
MNCIVGYFKDWVSYPIWHIGNVLLILCLYGLVVLVYNWAKHIRDSSERYTVYTVLRDGTRGAPRFPWMHLCHNYARNLTGCVHYIIIETATGTPIGEWKWYPGFDTTEAWWERTK